MGSGPEDAEQIMNHNFFEHINWQDVISRKLEPPFKPSLVNIINLNKTHYDNKYINFLIFIEKC